MIYTSQNCKLVKIISLYSAVIKRQNCRKILHFCLCLFNSLSSRNLTELSCRKLKLFIQDFKSRKIKMVSRAIVARLPARILVSAWTWSSSSVSLLAEPRSCKHLHWCVNNNKTSSSILWCYQFPVFFLIFALHVKKRHRFFNFAYFCGHVLVVNITQHNNFKCLESPFDIDRDGFKTIAFVFFRFRSRHGRKDIQGKTIV